MPMTLDDYKLYALQQAAKNGSAPDIAGGNGMDQLLNQQQPAQVTAPQPTQTQPGPIRNFLSNFLYGTGQGMLKKVGLETDAEKEQRQIQQQTAQQNAATQNLYRQAYAQQVAAQNQPVDLANFGIPGLEGTVLQKDVPGVIKQHVANLGKQGAAETAATARTKAAEIAAQAVRDRAALMYGNPDSPLRHQFITVGNQVQMRDKGTGAQLGVLGPSPASYNIPLRAQQNAAYGLTESVDQEGNPIGISRLQSLQTGAPAVPFRAAQNLASDRVGIQQYEDTINNKIVPNLSVLNDPQQRAIIAHTLAAGSAAHDPGAIQSLITSYAQQGLSPQGAALAAGILQGREFGPVARKYGGNMNGTEGLATRIMQNQASPLNAEDLNRELIANDLAFTRRAKTTLGKLTQRGVPTSQSIPAQQQPSGEKVPEYIRVNGKLVLKP